MEDYILFCSELMSAVCSFTKADPPSGDAASKAHLDQVTLQVTSVKEVERRGILARIFNCKLLSFYYSMMLGQYIDLLDP